MTNLIETYYAQAQLSDAAYAVLADGMSGQAYINALRDRGFTTAEATAFAANYSILKVYEDPATSFYAVLFERAGADGTSEKILSIRGTNDVHDLVITDLTQLTLTGLTGQNGSLVSFYADIVSRLAPTDTFTITGHSLGGFLAQIAAGTFPAPISHIYTFNAPGLNGAFSNLGGLFGFSNAIPSSLITNLVGTGQTFVASTGTQLGSKENIFIEEVSLLVNPVANHLIAPLKDSLALYALFAAIDTTVDQKVSSITEILKAASSTPATSLEQVLDGLRRLFLGPSITSTPVDTPAAYYDNITALKTSSAVNGNARVFSLANLSESSIAGLAKQDIAYRYAFQELNPFVVIGADYSMHNTGGALDLYDAQTGNGTMTALYLSDRAELLAKRLTININDGGTVPTDTHYVDVLTGFEVGSVASFNEVIFGDAQDNRDLTGHAGGDHLYGGDGNDLLTGQGGMDYLEGNQGNDELYGGSENDILLGQQGNDQLYGEADNDRLNGGLGDDRLDGGTGLDTYFYRTGQGQDTIVDADRLGTIQFDNQTLVGGLHRSTDPANTYVSPDGQFTYVKSGADLVINGTLTIENFDFASGTLGIKLAEAPDTAIPAVPTINYGANGLSTESVGLPLAQGSWVGTYAGFFNYVIHGEGSLATSAYLVQTDVGNDQFYGGLSQDHFIANAGDDWLEGAGGNDQLEGWGHDDVLLGGAGEDVLYGDIALVDAGDDYLDGGEGNDVLMGGAGDDVMLGGDGDDALAGDGGAISIVYGPPPISLPSFTLDYSLGTGNDLLDGGAGDDLLVGYAGADRLLGGDGVDLLHGDYNGGPVSVAWDPSKDGEDYLEGGAGNDELYGHGQDDVLLGGDGDDVLWGEGATYEAIAGDDWLEGGAGDDLLNGGRGTDALFGGEGNDLLFGDSADPSIGDDDTLDGGAGDDELQGGGGHDLLEGGLGNDFLLGQDGDDSLYGGEGLDELQGGVGADVLDGGADNDLVVGQAGNDTLFGGDGADELQGGEGDDDLAGETGDDFLLGDAGQDSLFGGDGADRLQGGIGDDLIVGDAGNDGLYGEDGVDQLFGDEGDDELYGGAGNDVLAGGAGHDYLDGQGDDNSLFGEEGNDQLVGGIGQDRLDGGTGNDRMIGGAGRDTYVFELGYGIDTVEEATLDGNNVVEFGAGITSQSLTLGTAQSGFLVRVGNSGDALQLSGFAVDTFQFADGTTLTYDQLLARGFDLNGTAGNDVITGTDVSDRITGGAGNDTLSGMGGVDTIQGGDGADILRGGTSDDRLQGDADDDQVFGDEGNDVIEGGVGVDTLDGGEGNDLLRGGSGNDALFGGPGDDTYELNLGDGLDRVLDFAFPGEGNRILFGAGLSADAARLRMESGELYIRFTNTPEGISAGSRDDEDIFGAHAVEQFEFSDGTVYSYEDLMTALAVHGVEVVGTPDDDFLMGTMINDRFLGEAGNDELFGGFGDDEYVFNLGDGVDTITDEAFPGEENAIVFGPGITSADVRLDVASDPFTSVTSLLLHVGTDGDALQLTMFDPQNVFGPRTVETLRFADGSTLTYDQLLAQGFDLMGTAGDDQLTGTNTVDRLTGDEGNDTLRAGAGDDSLDGGLGDDRLVGGQGNDAYLFGPGSGHDTIVESQGNLDTIRMAPGVAPSDVVVTRSNQDLVLSLNGGADQLTVSLYFLTPSLQTERVAFDDGTIWDQTFIEALTQSVVSGTAGPDVLVGTIGDDRLAGLAGDDQLTGLAGQDVLDGGTEADQLTGGLGDDIYLVDDAGDVVIEGADEGTDTVQSTVSRSLEANVENLTLTGTAAINGTGNALDNVLIGNSAANVLTGGLGNDTYVAGPEDTIVEAANEGIDTLLSAATATLGANVEHLTLTGNQSINGTGNALNNILTGNQGINFLAGGLGDDTYVVGSEDVVLEQSGEGTDTIQSASTTSLGANIENVTLLGSSAIDGIGNDLANALTGNAGTNVLEGRGSADRLDGGAGADTLLGGSGQDTYLFQRGSGQDILQDVVSGELDTIQLGPGIAPSDLRVALNTSSELFLEIRGTDDRLTLRNYSPLNSNDQATKEVRFADGTVWDGATLASRIESPPGPNPGQFSKERSGTMCLLELRAMIPSRGWPVTTSSMVLAAMTSSKATSATTRSLAATGTIRSMPIGHGSELPRM